MKREVGGNSIVSAACAQVSCDLKGEAAILDLDSGVYYGLNAVGSRIWQLIQLPRSVGSLLETLSSEYAVEPDRCKSDLLELLESLADAGLIDVQAEAVS